MAQGGGGDLLEVGGSLFHGRLRRQLGFAEYTPSILGLLRSPSRASLAPTGFMSFTGARIDVNPL
jgi:hypothetical protein